MTKAMAGSLSSNDELLSVGPMAEFATPADRPINILIVDDEPKNLTVLETVLDSACYRLVRADSAKEALIALLAEDFALLILDVQMPEVTGFELAQMVKQRKKTSQIPIIFLTAYYNQDQDVIEGYDSGAVDYLLKPINPVILRSKVAVLAELHRNQRELVRANQALQAEVAERRDVQAQLHELNETLERRVSERTQALHESSRLLRAAADNASVGLVILDQERRYRFANSAYGRILGLGDQIVGKSPAELMASSYEEQIAFQLDRAFAGERVVFELSRCIRIGAVRETRQYSIVYEPEMDDGGKVVSVVEVVIDLTDYKRVEQHIRMLMNEVNHRSKNILSVVLAIAQQTVTLAPQEFMGRFSERIRALAVSHDLLVRNQWTSITVGDLVSAQLAHFADLIGDRIMINGPPLFLSATAAQSIGMVMHELATNSAKYGALSDQRGHVKVTWVVDGEDNAQNFAISWVERGGPACVAPSRRGFGSRVITSMAELSLDANTRVEFPSSGFIWRLDCPVENVFERGGISGRATL